MFRVAGLMVALFILVGNAPAQAPKDIQKEIARLNNLTGSEPSQEALKALLDEKAQAKSLIAAAMPLAKEKGKLTYNASLILALTAAELKDLPACEVFFRNCIEQAGKLQSVTKLLQSFGGLIEIFYDNKKYDESAKLCKELIDLKTDDGKERIVLFAYTNRRTGETEFYEGDSFNTTEPLQPFIFRQLVQSMAKQGKYDQAHKVLDNLIKQTNDWRDRQLKGWLLREEGKFLEAATAYEDLIERMKTDRQISEKERLVAIDRNQYILSNIYVDLKKVDKATEMLQNLIKAHPNDPGYNNDLGYIWADHGMNLDEAEKLIRHALEQDRLRRKSNPDLGTTDNGAYLDSLGWVLYKKKQLKEAKEALSKAVEDKNAQHIEIFDHLGDVLIALGDREAALDAWRKGLEHVTESRRDQDRKKLVEEKLKKHGAK